MSFSNGRGPFGSMEALKDLRCFCFLRQLFLGLLHIPYVILISCSQLIPTSGMQQRLPLKNSQMHMHAAGAISLYDGNKLPVQETSPVPLSRRHSNALSIYTFYLSREFLYDWQKWPIVEVEKEDIGIFNIVPFRLSSIAVCHRWRSYVNYVIPAKYNYTLRNCTRKLAKISILLITHHQASPLFTLNAKMKKKQNKKKNWACTASQVDVKEWPPYMKLSILCLHPLLFLQKHLPDLNLPRNCTLATVCDIPHPLVICKSLFCGVWQMELVFV